MILLASVYYGAMYGGRISSILINIPGDEPALMTTLDGYPMTLKGRAGEALTLTGISSFFWCNGCNSWPNVFSTAVSKNCSFIWTS
jgi:TctA family transporter